MDIETTAHYPEELSEDFKQKLEENIQKYGHQNVQWMINVATLQKVIEEEIKKNPTRVDVFLQLVFHVVFELSSQDVLPPHNICARETISRLEKIPYEEVDSEAVNMLAMELLKFCNKLSDVILTGKDGNKYEPLSDEKGNMILRQLDSNKELPETCFAKDGVLVFDKMLLDELLTFGKEGKTAHKELIKKWSIEFSNFLESEYQDMGSIFKRWISKEQSWSPPFLKLGCEILWKDVIQPRWKRKSSLKTPAIPKKIWSETVNNFLSPKNQVLELEDRVECRSESGEMIACSDVATIDKSFLSLMAAGLKGLSTLTGQKTFRWLVRTGWNNVVVGVSDPRLINTSGGFSGIADKIGCKNKTDSQRVKKVLYAMDGCRVVLPHGFEKVIDGRLLSMDMVKTSRNGHPSEINIILGTMLLPHVVFEFAKKDRLLLPVPELPPMIGDHRTFASQGMLQLYVLEEFSDHSRELAKKGRVHIPKEKWAILAEKAGLSPSMLSQILDRWKQEDGLLEAEGEYYTLNSRQYKAELQFLTDQGQRRESQSKRAKTPKRRKSVFKKN